mgnify:CR=1 FL=1
MMAIHPVLEALAVHLKGLPGPWRSEARRNGSFRVLYGGGKVAYWQSAQRPFRTFLDAADASDAAVAEFATVRPLYKNKPGLPIDVRDFEAFGTWICDVAPTRTLRQFHDQRARALSNATVASWE